MSASFPFTETHSSAQLLDPARSRRRRMALGAAGVMGYAAAVLVVALMSADLGFFAHAGSPVVAVESGSAAARAGVRAGDVITAINGVVVSERNDRHQRLLSLEPDSRLSLTLERGGEVIHASFHVGRQMPWASMAAIFLTGVLLMMALLADRGGPGVLPRAFFRSTLVYVVFLSGTFSWQSVITTPLLAVPWLYSVTLAAPATCHFMLKFPAGHLHQSSRQLWLLYAAPLFVSTSMAVGLVLISLGFQLPYADEITLVQGGACIALAAACLSAGAVARARRLRAKRDQVDPVAARWLHVGGAVIATPLIAGAIHAAIDVRAFIAGGFRAYVAIAMIGGSACVVLAMTRVPIGELDRMWRRSSGHAVATALAACLFLVFLGLAGGTATVLSGGSFTTALAATLIAAVVFGPVRARVQQMVDERFARDRSRVRALLREAAEAAAATLDIDELVHGIADRVQAALSADGAAIYTDASDGWKRIAVAGQIPIQEHLSNDDPVARRMNAALTARASRELCGGVLGVPLIVQNLSAILVVAPRDPRKGLDDEERELVQTIAAQLVVAIGNARAHTELRELNEKLLREYERAEKRRKQIARLKERVEEENRALMGQLASRDGRQPVVGKGLERTFELVQKVARTNTTVLVRGETGVGKELIARAIHAGSARRSKPFIVVDCGAISPSLFESALFGHERGAFTGAVASSLGAFRAADGGTIFLDELGELPRDLQPKLLRVLQERVVQPVGSDKTVPIDVRVVAGTNRDLAAEVRVGNFRQDLLYRLQVLEIYVPPLRQRRDDVDALAESFLDGIAERTGRPRKQLTDDARQALRDHAWPGNVRELEHTLEAAVVYAEGENIQPSDLPIYEQVFRARSEQTLDEKLDNGQGQGLRETLEDLERDRLIEALREHEGNRTRAAKALGMSRGALLRRISRYNLQSDFPS